MFHRGVPWVREVNVVRVEATHRVRAGDIAFAAETRLPAAPAVEVLHEPIGAALAPAFAAAGWQVSRHLLMALEARRPRALAGSRRSSPSGLAAARGVDARGAVGHRGGGGGDARRGSAPARG